MNVCYNMPQNKSQSKVYRQIMIKSSKSSSDYDYIAVKIGALRSYNFFRNRPDSYIFSALCVKSNFYKDMTSGNFEGVNKKVQQRFLTLEAETGEESKIIFVFYTSAQQGKINTDRLENKFKEQFSDPSNIEVRILFASDIVSEIREAEARRPTVESGRLNTDRAGNILKYGDDAVIANISALSLKRLYAMHGTNLLARNLRYHIKSGREIDRAIGKPPHG